MALKCSVSKRKTIRGGLSGVRLYIQFVDGMNCRWREFLPFFLTGQAKRDRELYAKASEIAASRQKEYEALEAFAEQGSVS